MKIVKATKRFSKEVRLKTAIFLPKFEKSILLFEGEPKMQRRRRLLVPCGLIRRFWQEMWKIKRNMLGNENESIIFIILNIEYHLKI